MSSPPRSAALLILVLLISSADARLTRDFYSTSCPRFLQIVQDEVTAKQITHPTTGAGVIRLVFHDCITNGCDASVLLSSTPLSPPAERDSDINLSLPGDAFDLVVRIKTALELACPSVVSCSDILLAATRDLLVMLGGPYLDLAFGRRDTRISRASFIAGLLPRSNMTVSDLIKLFAARGFSVQEMVVLAGAHTVGFSHCKEFSSGIYNYSTGSPYDPTYNPRYAQGLQSACSQYQTDPTLSVVNDVMTPNKFDNVYYQNLPKGLGLLATDRGLYGDPRTRPFVEMYAADQNRFFRDFARAMQKMSLLGIKTGRRGEIRRRCDEVN